ncbi:UNVERIFIED_ORG: DNA invertase Pin-like site-specific DNA recombinase [Bacillus sp. 1751]|nr:DNA invertase Pin-like site-specific DNA recombinase [Bacillus sp. 1751]
MFEKNLQRHIGRMAYADKDGNRFLHVSSRSTPKNKNKTKDINEEFYKMVINDYTPQEIAIKLGISLPLVIDYFKTEGLI